MKGLKANIKGDMEILKEGLKKLLQERLPSGDKVFHETMMRKKMNVNCYVRDFNFGLKTDHIPNIDMRKFDGKDLVKWVPQMVQFFDIHDMQHTQKVHITSLCLESNQFVWYRWICSHKSLVTWINFMKELITHYEDTREIPSLAN